MAMDDFDIAGEARLEGPFEASWESLRAGYQAPDWYRDAKFGLWAHWGAQCVPEAGDWYARNMYVQGHPQYEHHVRNYGHPVDVGFIEIQRLWAAEHWDPDALLDLYNRAGAKYFVAMANHHDNLDAWDSRWHDWNTTRVGPGKDIIGIWAQKARDRGLRFGVSNHAAHAWHWFQTAYGYDPEGPRAGQRYDAWRLSRHDGAGKWWAGLDPQELYAGATMPLPDGIKSTAEAVKWHEDNDLVWNESPPLSNPIFVRNWFRRCKDLVDRYQPDLLYFDNFDLPLGQAGLDIAAHYYNSSVLRTGGEPDVVITTKELRADRRGAVIEDVERGFRGGLEDTVWQTDTCIGEWHYNRDLFEQKRYVGAMKVIQRLCDVVSKNGNLLLSVPLKGDGTIDAEERKIVEGIGGWLARFDEAIYGTRPWHVFGEGPTAVVPGQFGEAKAKPFSSEDIRFTTQQNDLFAITLGPPTAGQVKVSSLADGRGARGQVERVEVVGRPDPLPYVRDAGRLHVQIPDSALDDYGVALRIRGRGLVD